MSQRILATVPDVLAERLPSADILLPRYSAGRLSNADPVLIAASLSNLIEEQYQRGRYRQVILVGHSRGALLARKAYVLARGETSELAHGGLTPADQDIGRMR